MEAQDSRLEDVGVPETDDWPAIKAWRKRARALLLARRAALGHHQRQALRDSLVGHLESALPLARPRTLGFYWPFKAEVDLRDFVRKLIAEGIEAALPVVVEKGQPVEFWRWRPGAGMARGIWDIPIPATREPCHPDVLLVPLVGFDEAGYRLGFGGGYYDRTLAAARPQPLAIGIGLELGRLPSIYPQPHDIPMNMIVTEAGCFPAQRP